AINPAKSSGSIRASSSLLQEVKVTNKPKSPKTKILDALPPRTPKMVFFLLLVFITFLIIFFVLYFIDDKTPERLRHSFIYLKLNRIYYQPIVNCRYSLSFLNPTNNL